MNSFVKQVAHYFQNFLETDFRKRRLPKRNIVLRNKDGAKISINLDKYKNFKRTLISQLEKPDKFEFKFDIKLKQYSANIEKISTKYIVKKVADDLKQNRGIVEKLFQEKLVSELIKHAEDIERFHESCESNLIEILADKLFGESVSAIHDTLRRINESESAGVYEIANELAQILFSSDAEKFHEGILEFSVNQKEDLLEVFFDDLLEEGKIQNLIQEYFETFAVSDFYADLFVLDREVRSKDNLEGYLYIGEIVFNKKSFPLTFIPIEINTETTGQISLTFEKRYYVNKQAIEYVYQQSTNSRNSASVATLFPERTIILDEKETLAESIEETLQKVASRGFQITDVFSDGLNLLSTISRDMVKLKNSFYISVADKGDESALNDYEEILGMIDSEDGLFQELAELINSFISGNPENVASSIREEWSDMTIEDRLVYESPIPVNEEQRKIISAINSSKSKYVTVQGPPGTGKSHTISAILFQAIKENRSVLLLSDKKEALDVVEEKLTDTLNKVRPNENFQNPILRIGKTGNTYSKILNRQSAENIRISYEATRQTLEENKDNLKNEVKSLKTALRDTIDGYQQIDLEAIHEHYALCDELGAASNEVDDLLYLKDVVDNLKNCLLEIDTIMETMSDVDSGFFDTIAKSIDSHENQLDAMVFLSSIASSSSFEAIKNVVSDIRLNDYDFIKSALKEYSLTKAGFWGSIFSRFLLSGWQKKLVMELDLFGVIDFRREVSVLENYKKVLDAIRKAEINPKDKITSLLSSMHREQIPDAKLFSSLRKLFDTSLQCVSLLREKAIFKNNLSDDLPNLHSNFDRDKNFLSRLSRLLQVTRDLRDHFEEIKDIRFLDNSKDIQQDAAIEMTQEFDRKFLDFFENSASDAKTFKKIISQKLRFPKKDFHKLKSAFPCIIAGIRDYAEYIPLDKEVFDLLIIDEASQVSIAQAFPALIRSKKILVLGDNKQFSNVKSATASNEINNNFVNSLGTCAAEEFGEDPLKVERTKVFNVRTSILDFFEYTSNYSALLKKHFRGYPELISFSSKYFYEGSLQALKVRAKPIEEVIEFNLIDHDGYLETKKNINSLEAQHIKLMLEAKLDEKDPMSVAVITPFKDQQSFILSEIDRSEHRSDIYSKLKLKVMTFDSCQGEERDHVIYSFVESSASKVRTSSVLGAKFEQDMDPEQSLRLQRLNVGMSRAKEKITFVISQGVEKFSGNGFLILSHYQEQLKLAKELPESSETESPMERKLLAWIKQTSFYQKYASSIEIKAQFNVSKYIKTLDPTYNHPNYRCDFLFTFRRENNSKVAIIEYDGFEFHFENLDRVNAYNYEHYYTERDVERERILESYGFPFIRFNRFNLGKEPVQTISNKLESFFLPSQ